MVLSFCRLALGCISPRYIYQQIKQYEKQRTANQSTYWLVLSQKGLEYLDEYNVKLHAV